MNAKGSQADFLLIDDRVDASVLVSPTMKHAWANLYPRYARSSRSVATARKSRVRERVIPERFQKAAWFVHFLPKPASQSAFLRTTHVKRSKLSPLAPSARKSAYS